MKRNSFIGKKIIEDKVLSCLTPAKKSKSYTLDSPLLQKILNNCTLFTFCCATGKL